MDKFKCNVCEKLFACKEYLQVHQARHFSNRLFTCVICSKSYRDKIGLKRHFKKAHIQSTDNDSSTISEQLETTVIESVKEVQTQPIKLETRVADLDDLPIQERKIRLISKCKTNESDEDPLYVSSQSLMPLEYTDNKQSSTISEWLEPMVIIESVKPFESSVNEESSTSSERQDTMKSVKEKKEELKCDDCSRTFKYYSLLKRHMRSHTTVKNVSKCPMCPFSATKLELIDHFKLTHDIELETDNFVFNNLDEFTMWKDNLEETEFCSYIMYCKHLRSDGTVRYSYRCHRDGSYQSVAKVRQPKSVGSVKIGGYCPSQLDVVCDKSQVIVCYLKTHVGHTPEVERLRIDNITKQQLAQKIALKIPLNSILDDVKDSATNNTVNRLHFLKKKDLYNIEMQYGLKQKDKEHKDDDYYYDNDYTNVNSQDCSEKKAELLDQYIKLVNNAETTDQLDFLLQRANTSERLLQVLIDEQSSISSQFPNPESQNVLEKSSAKIIYKRKRKAFSFMKQTEEEKQNIAKLKLVNPIKNEK